MASFRFSPPRALALAAALLALLGLGFFVAAREWQRADKGAEEKGVLADVLSRALSTPATKISIGGIDGALSSDATVRDLKISDRDGVWLTVDRIRIVWRRLALLHGILSIRALPPATRRAWGAFFEQYVFGAHSESIEHIPADRRGILGELSAEQLNMLRAHLAKKLTR